MNDRYILQIQFNSRELNTFCRTWDIFETFNSLSKCRKMSEGLIDKTVRKARIVDKVKNEVVENLV